jgi:hypothetical protein
LHLYHGACSNFVIFVDHVTYISRPESEKTAMEQEVDELQHKLEVSKQRL